MTQLGVVTITNPEIEKHVRRMSADNEGKPFAQWPHKVDYTQDGGGTWTFTCATCDISWKIEDTRRSDYHGDLTRLVRHRRSRWRRGLDDLVLVGAMGVRWIAPRGLQVTPEPDGIPIDPNYTPHRIPEHCLRLGTRKSYVADNNTTPKKEKTHVPVPREK